MFHYQSLVYILIIAFCFPVAAATQVLFEQTYPLTFPVDSNGLRRFPVFELEQTAELISLTDCVDGTSTAVEVQQNTGMLLDNLSTPNVACDQLPLSNGTTLAIEPDPNGSFAYQLTNFLPTGAVVWQQLYSEIPFFLNADNVLSNPTGGFYLYNRSPFIIQKYTATGDLLYSTEPLDLPTAYGSRVLTITETGDLYVRSGHLGGNETRYFMTKINGADGTVIWQTEIPSVRNLAQDTRIAVQANYPVVIVENFYGSPTVNNKITGGWAMTFLNPTSGEIIAQQQKSVVGNIALSPVIVPNRGVYCLEEQYVDERDEELNVTEAVTGYHLLHFSETGTELSRQPLFQEMAFSMISIPQLAVAETGDLLFIGTKNDQLWLVKYGLEE